MKILDPGLDLEKFFEDLHRAAKQVLFIDYDGTLAPFRIEREKAVPYPGVRQALESILETCHSRVVLVSGRTIKDIIPLIGLKTLPEIWGCHGWERMLPDSTYTPPDLRRTIIDGLSKAHAWADSKGMASRCEAKTACLALHWRGMTKESVLDIRNELEDKWKAIADEHGLMLQEFNGGIELRPPGRDKGYAVEKVLEETGEGTVAAYMGDDITDEDAFKTLHGRGLSILVCNEFHQTAADLFLKPPEELLDFLHRWSEACGG